jgi:hypothetical protein
MLTIRSTTPCILAATALLAACAPMGDGGMAEAPAGSARQCFSIQQISNFRSDGAERLYLRVGQADVFEAQLTSGCQDLESAIRITVVPEGAASGSLLCTGQRARIVAAESSLPASACRVRITRQLTPEDVAALPSRSRP